MEKAATVSVWRIQLTTDLTDTKSPVIPLGVMLEAEWAKAARGLGMLFRRHLTKLELDHINLHTWPELDQLEPFMRGLFDEAWKASSARLVTDRFPARSALSFMPLSTQIDLGAFDRRHSITMMVDALLSFEETLKPAISAPVLPFMRKQVAAPFEDVHFTAEAA